MAFLTTETRTDGFLGGRLAITQPRRGYRAGADAVMLAAAVAARPGQRVLEIGCGAGVAALCLGHRVPGLALSGLELQADYAALARANAAANGVPLTVHQGDLRAMPAALRAQDFDHVLMNPPYFLGGTPAEGGRGTARHEAVPVGAWIAAGLRRLVPGGWLTVIQRADRLAPVLAALQGPAGDLRVLPLSPRAGRPAGRVIVAGRKGARAPLTLLAPFILHHAARHEGDGEDLTEAAQAVLRRGGAISLHFALSG